MMVRLFSYLVKLLLGKAHIGESLLGKSHGQANHMVRQITQLGKAHQAKHTQSKTLLVKYTLQIFRCKVYAKCMQSAGKVYVNAYTLPVPCGQVVGILPMQSNYKQCISMLRVLHAISICIIGYMQCVCFTYTINRTFTRKLQVKSRRLPTPL